MKVAAISYDMSGQVKTHSIDAVTTHYSEQQMDTARRLGVPVLQSLMVRRGAKFLLLSVVNLESGRIGTVQLSLASSQ